MGTLQCYELHISICALLFFLHYSSLQFLSLAYVVPDKYFINCGSDSTVGDSSGRNFAGESSSLSCFFPKHSSTTEKEGNQSPPTTTPRLYQTARLFQSKSAYKFRIQNQGYHLLRLHFFAFSSPGNLSSARFNVSVPGSWLLNNFSAQNKTNKPLIKEFFLSINRNNFQIIFSPLQSSFAFINAIELFHLPDNFTPDVVDSHVTPKGNMSTYKGILSRVLHTSYRLSVGGSGVTVEQDMLWRNWDSDDRYATNGTEFHVPNITPVYKGGDPGVLGIAATRYIAPDLVYQNARVTMKNTNSRITWVLDVKKNAKHLVRAHFCYIMGRGTLETSHFNLYFYNNFRKPISSYDYFNQNNVPFYFNFVVDSDDSGVMKISVGPDHNSSDKCAYLNGLEVMEIIEATGPGPMEERKHHFHLVLVSALGAVALICTVVVGFFVCLKFRKLKPDENVDWLPLAPQGVGSSHSRWGSSHGSSPVPNFNLELKIPFAEIQVATNNFERKWIIGKGGFGIVYKGVLKNGSRVAVKRSEPGLAQGLPEFQTEIMVLSKIRHRHLVSLIGYCDERSEMILVYEYMEKGTLKDHLYNSSLPNLSWTQRLEICIGAARGLNYLHKGSSGGIIHRDVKSTNILLDENHVAKVADFGLSRPGPLDQQPHVITGVKGTFGYLDPEYFRSHQLTEKSDVYSFGVVLLEVLCARSAIDTNPMVPREQVNLAEWGILCKNKGTLEEIIDPSIKGQIDANSLRKFSEIVEKCLRGNGFDRPGMGDVLWDLEYALQLQRGAMQREPHRNSWSGVSASLELPMVRRLPSFSTVGKTEEMAILRDDQSR